MHTFYSIANAILKNNIEINKFEYEFLRHPINIDINNTQSSVPIQQPINNTNHYFITRVIDGRIFPSSFLFLTMLSSHGTYSARYKLEYLQSMLNNSLITDELKEDFFNLFSKIQKIYHVLNLFVFRYNCKNAVTQVKSDMFLNPIELGSPRVICIYQNNNKYLFTCNDLVNIINNSLGHNVELFADPLIIKNPYNNMPFGKSILYTIYFFMKKQSFIIPTLFHAFFLCNFNLSQFLINNEMILREYAINEFFNKSSINIICREIKLMILNSPYKNSLKIHIKFPKEALAKALKPILRYYLDAYYSLNKTKRSFAIAKWKIQLDHFVNNNPGFGRRKVERRFFFDSSGNNINEHKIVFVTENNKIQENLFHDFMNDHLVQYTEDVDVINFRNLLVNYESSSDIDSDD